MKKVFYLAAILAMMACTGGQQGGSISSFTNTGGETNEESTSPIQYELMGELSPTEYEAGKEVSITFDRFPTTLAEFKNLQSQLGQTPQGAVVLQLMAFHLYSLDHSAGEEAVTLNNIESNVPSVMRQIPDKLGGTEYKDQLCPHLVATFLEGATPENGYNPTKPYTVRVRVSPVHSYQRSEMMQGYVLYLDVYSSGYDSSWRGCEVIKQKGSEVYQVSNSPSMYTQCKPIPFDCEAEFRGL